MKNTPLKTEELKQQLREHVAHRSPQTYGKLWDSFRRVLRDGLDYSQGNPMFALWQHLVELGRQYQSRRGCQSRPSKVGTCRSFWH